MAGSMKRLISKPLGQCIYVSTGNLYSFFQSLSILQDNNLASVWQGTQHVHNTVIHLTLVTSSAQQPVGTADLL